tara:strand:+ start:295 stop:570 length:276 start_codon:yes stop_codon:yes gene_type:complete
MLQKLETLDNKLDKLNEINNEKFLFEKFKEINSQIETTLAEIRSNELNDKKKYFSQDELNFFKKLIKKIELLETKILPKAHLIQSFSKYNT